MVSCVAGARKRQVRTLTLLVGESCRCQYCCGRTADGLQTGRQLQRTAAAPTRIRQPAVSGGPCTTPPQSRHVQVVCRPQHVLDGWCPTSIPPGRKRWPRGQLCGSRVIHDPSVQRTRAPTAGHETNHPPASRYRANCYLGVCLPPADITKWDTVWVATTTRPLGGQKRKN